MNKDKIIDKIEKKIDSVEKLHDKESLMCEEIKDLLAELRDEEEDGFIWSSLRIYLRNVGVFATDTSDAIGNSYIFSFVNQNKYNTIPIVIERMGGRKLGCIFSKSAYI